MKRSYIFISALLLLSILSPAWAQLARGEDPAQVADEAVEAWLERARSFDLMALTAESPAEVCREFLAVGLPPQVVGDTQVNFDDRRELTQDIPEGQRVYSYPARVGNAGLARVQVWLTEVGGDWHADAVRLHMEGPRPTLPGFVQGELAGWAFMALTAYLIFLLSRPSWFRRWLGEGWKVLLEHRGIVLGTIIALYGAYTLGSLFGVALPECQQAIGSFVGDQLAETGVVDVLATDSVPQLSVAITYWNFVNGAINTTLGPAIIFALPAYLINLSRFFLIGIALAPVGAQAVVLIFHLPVIIIELMAYVLITAGGGIFAMTLIRQGLRSFREAFRRLILTVPIAFVLLVIGAWYESFEILRLIPFFLGM